MATESMSMLDPDMKSSIVTMETMSNGTSEEEVKVEIIMEESEEIETETENTTNELGTEKNGAADLPVLTENTNEAIEENQTDTSATPQNNSATFTSDIISARIQAIVQAALAKRGLSSNTLPLAPPNKENGITDSAITVDNHLIGRVVDKNVVSNGSTIVEEYRAYKAKHFNEKKSKKMTVPNKTNSSELVQVEKLTRNEQGQWECDICHEIFTRMSKLKAHKKSHEILPWWASDDVNETHDDVITALMPQISTSEPVDHCKDGVVIKFESGALVPVEISVKSDQVIESTSTKETPSKAPKVPKRTKSCQKRKRNAKKKKTGEDDESKSGKAVRGVVTYTEIPAQTKLNSNGRWPCHLCEKDYYCRQALKGHLRAAHTGEKPYKCRVCETAFHCLTNKTIHERQHSGDRPFKCQVCDRAFKQSAHLRSHMRQHTGEKPYSCRHCQKRFAHSCARRAHERIHTGEKPYKCDACPKAFRESCKLKVHKQQKHSDERNYACTQCDQTFKVLSSLRTHKRAVHDQEKNHECTVCGKKYFAKGQLDDHTRLHTKEKPHQCPHCPKQFRLRVSLNLHVRIHTGEKPYICEFCGKRFSQHPHYNVHRKIHTNEYPYGCDRCKKCFRSGTALLYHTRVCKVKLACQVCDQLCTGRKALRVHEFTHDDDPMVCHVCRRGFVGFRALRRHDCLPSERQIRIKEEPLSGSNSRSSTPTSSSSTKTEDARTTEKVESENSIENRQFSGKECERTEQNVGASSTDVQEPFAGKIEKEKTIVNETLDESQGRVSPTSSTKSIKKEYVENETKSDCQNETASDMNEIKTNLDNNETGSVVAISETNLETKSVANTEIGSDVMICDPISDDETAMTVENLISTATSFDISKSVWSQSVTVLNGGNEDSGIRDDDSGLPRNRNGVSSLEHEHYEIESKPFKDKKWERLRDCFVLLKRCDQVKYGKKSTNEFDSKSKSNEYAKSIETQNEKSNGIPDSQIPDSNEIGNESNQLKKYSNEIDRISNEMGQISNGMDRGSENGPVVVKSEPPDDNISIDEDCWRVKVEMQN